MFLDLLDRKLGVLVLPAAQVGLTPVEVGQPTVECGDDQKSEKKVDGHEGRVDLLEGGWQEAQEGGREHHPGREASGEVENPAGRSADREDARGAQGSPSSCDETPGNRLAHRPPRPDGPEGMGREGIEPSTLRLRVSCSTN